MGRGMDGMRTLPNGHHKSGIVRKITKYLQAPVIMKTMEPGMNVRQMQWQNICIIKSTGIPGAAAPQVAPPFPTTPLPGLFGTIL